MEPSIEEDDLNDILESSLQLQHVRWTRGGQEESRRAGGQDSRCEKYRGLNQSGGYSHFSEHLSSHR